MMIKRGIWGDENMQGKRRALILLHKGGSYCLKAGWAVEDEGLEDARLESPATVTLISRVGDPIQARAQTMNDK